MPIAGTVGAGESNRPPQIPRGPSQINRLNGIVAALLDFAEDPVCRRTRKWMMFPDTGPWILRADGQAVDEVPAKKGSGMKVFCDLDIYATREQSDALVKRMTENLVAPWHRDSKAEERWRTRSLGNEEHYSFAREDDGRLPGAILALMRKDDRSIYVPNIVPPEIGQLSMDQYNDILCDFVEKVFKPVKSDDIEYKLTPDHESIDDWLSPETAKKFHYFAQAPKASSHPNDRKRWFGFLVAANKEEKRLRGDMLRRYLIEDGHWPEVEAAFLASEYNFAMDLLDHARGEQAWR